MKFIKGVIWGTVISAGVAMLFNETSKSSKKKMMKQGKKIMKNMGIM